MKYLITTFATLLVIATLTSFHVVDRKLATGYYWHSHGHVTQVYEIKGDKIHWYLDNVIKSFGQGSFRINEQDSVIEVSLDKLRTSDPIESETNHFDFLLDLTFDKTNGTFKLKSYNYSKDEDWIPDMKRRVKSICRIRVERPSR